MTAMVVARRIVGAMTVVAGAAAVVGTVTVVVTVVVSAVVVSAVVVSAAMPMATAVLSAAPASLTAREGVVMGAADLGSQSAAVVPGRIVRPVACPGGTCRDACRREPDHESVGSYRVSLHLFWPPFGCLPFENGVPRVRLSSGRWS
jgi:hypothetical protein